MTQFSYTQDAWKSQVKNPEDRQAALKKLVEQLGGRLVCFYYAFGDYDRLVIAEIPDAPTMVTVLMAVMSAGHVSGLKTSQLFSMEDAMAVMGRAGKIVYAAQKG